MLARLRRIDARDVHRDEVGVGAERVDDLRVLLSFGCDRVLGAFIAPAMPGEQFRDWVVGWDPNRLGVGLPE